MIKGILMIGIAMLMLASPASAFDIVREDVSTWTCVDHSISFARENPEWGIVSMSNHPGFRGVSHMVNYRVLDSETLLIHDGLYNAEYQLSGWWMSGEYYHFWQGEPIRNYIRLFDNREVVLCEN